MKVFFDIDGTLTNYNEFVKKYAYPYFTSKYGMNVVYPEKLEIEDIFDMENFFIEKYNVDSSTAKQMKKKTLDKFWISYRFIIFTLFTKFRPGVKEYINKMIKDGHKLEIHSSRAKTCDKSIIGNISRMMTIMQCKLNGINISKKDIHFYHNDEEKINGIVSLKPDLVFDDKPEIIEKLSDNKLRCICISGSHNIEVNSKDNIFKISDFDQNSLNEAIKGIMGIRKSNCYYRAAQSDIFFDKIKIFKNVILFYLKPIVLHKENLIDVINEPVIYAPNHRSTLDPLVITSLINKNIHWAALLRFFKGTDSIFNNSKNPILCKITSSIFKKLEYFPIDRKSDNPDANNFESIKDMNNFLSVNQNIGIFGEGTTRRPEGKDFGTFDDSFLLLAQKNNAWVQPITTLWIKDLQLNYKLIINYGKPFKVEKGKIDEAMTNFMKIQQDCLDENMKLKEELKRKVIIKK